jgi:hypothetical protein
VLLLSSERLGQPSSAPAAGSPSQTSQSWEARLSGLFADAPFATPPQEQRRLEAERRLRALHRDIDARLEANRRLAEGTPSPALLPGSCLKPSGIAPEGASAAGKGSGGALLEAQIELEVQRALTDFLEQAVLSW